MLILGAYHAQADHCQLKDFASVLQMGVSRQHHKCNFGLDSIKREASLGAPLLHLKMCAVTLQAKAQGKFAENHLCTNCKCKCNLNVLVFSLVPWVQEIILCHIQGKREKCSSWVKVFRLSLSKQLFLEHE